MLSADPGSSLQPRRKKIAKVAPYLVSGVLLIFVPPLLPVYLQSMMTKVLVFAIFAMSLTVLFGYTGLFSLGHAAFFGVAGYTTGILTLRYGVKIFWLTMPASILMATIFAAIFGIVALRVSGIYFLLVTFALGQLLYSVAIKWYSLTGGYYGLAGIRLPDLGLPWIPWNTISFYYFVFVAFVVTYFLLSRFLNSPFGRALQGVREGEPRMRALGYNTWLYKYVAFIVGGLFAGLGGTLFAHFNGLMAPEHLGFQTSGFVMLMVIMGGANSLSGPIIGCLVTVFLQFFASTYAPKRWPLILGAAFVLVVMFLRGGISSHLQRFWKKVQSRLWKH